MQDSKGMSCMEQVISIERIEHEARAAAQRYSDVNAACPYPFFSDAGHAFMAVFKQERQHIESQSSTHQESQS